MQNDLTTGSVFRNVLSFSLPYLLSYFLYVSLKLYSFVRYIKGIRLRQYRICLSVHLLRYKIKLSSNAASDLKDFSCAVDVTLKSHCLLVNTYLISINYDLCSYPVLIDDRSCNHLCYLVCKLASVFLYKFR